jgi:CheY-like chemotaxis protein
MDPSQFHQIMMNLATNAAHAMRTMAAPRLSLRARLEDAPQQITRLTPTLQAGRTLLVEVQDNGHGMNQAVLSRIFEPFFTTKPQGEGTGLGLSVVHGIVKDAGGNIHVSSTEGKGTLFQLYFPAVDAEAHGPDSKPEFRFVGTQQRVLFVDDEEFLCTLMRKLLSSFNLQVTVASNPLKALEILRSGEAFDLVISDFTMPGMTGLAIAKELWAHHPNVPFILASGLIKAETRAELEQAGVHYILPKPFTAASVAVAISECLGGSVS